MGAEAVSRLDVSTPYLVADAAWPRLAATGVLATVGLRGVGHRDGADTYRRVDELCEQMAEVCASAVDPLEIAAALEFEGVGDRSVREWYGFPDVFALAEEMYRRVPRRPSEPLPLADPHRRRLLRSVLHGLLYGLPAVYYPAATGLLFGRTALTVLIVSMLVSWAIGQGLAHLGYRRLGWTGVGQARRVLRGGLAVGMGMVVLIMAVTALVMPAPVGSVAFGVGQGAYMLGACVLMVLGIEHLLVVVLAPGLLGATAFLVLGRPPVLEPAVWGALAATPMLALVLAVVCTRQTGPATTGRLFVAAELRGALPSLAFGFLAAALTAFPIAVGLPGRPGANVGAVLAAVPLSLSMGAAEWSLYWYRRKTQRLLRSTAHLDGFARAARLVLLNAVLQYLAAACLLTGAAIAVAAKTGLVPPQEPVMAGLVAYLALGGAMFVALLLQAFGVRRVTLLACAAALAYVVLFSDRGASAQVVAYAGLFGFLGAYAAVVLGRAVRHMY